MKLKRLIILSLLLCASCFALSQESDTATAYYDYELRPNGNIYNGIDTAYTLTIIIDAAEISQFASIDFETETKIKKLNVKPEDLEKDPSIKYDKDKYQIEVGEVNGNGFKVYAERIDGTLVVMKDKKKKGTVNHKVIDDESKRRNLTFFEGEPVVEPIPIPEPEPEEPDTTAYRKNKF